MTTWTPVSPTVPTWTKAPAGPTYTDTVLLSTDTGAILVDDLGNVLLVGLLTADAWDSAGTTPTTWTRVG